jgi:hypothetical protein
MLSIRVVEEDGHEYIKPDIKLVVYNPAVIETAQKASLFLWKEPSLNNPPETVLSGRVYVMNELGKTIAKYDIYELPFKADG